jgi:hypothetical protein
MSWRAGGRRLQEHSNLSQLCVGFVERSLWESTSTLAFNNSPCAFASARFSWIMSHIDLVRRTSAKSMTSAVPNGSKSLVPQYRPTRFRTLLSTSCPIFGLIHYRRNRKEALQGRPKTWMCFGVRLGDSGKARCSHPRILFHTTTDVSDRYQRYETVACRHSYNPAMWPTLVGRKERSFQLFNLGEDLGLKYGSICKIGAKSLEQFWRDVWAATDS